MSESVVSLMWTFVISEVELEIEKLCIGWLRNE